MKNTCLAQAGEITVLVHEQNQLWTETCLYFLSGLPDLRDPWLNLYLSECGRGIYTFQSVASIPFRVWKRPTPSVQSKHEDLRAFKVSTKMCVCLPFHQDVDEADPIRVEVDTSRCGSRGVSQSSGRGSSSSSSSCSHSTAGDLACIIICITDTGGGIPGPTTRQTLLHYFGSSHQKRDGTTWVCPVQRQCSFCAAVHPGWQSLAAHACIIAPGDLLASSLRRGSARFVQLCIQVENSCSSYMHHS